MAPTFVESAGEAEVEPESVEPPAEEPARAPTRSLLTATAQPEATAVPPAITEAPVFPEQRLLSLEWPKGIRVGDSDLIRLVLAVDESGNLTPTAAFDDHEFTVEPVEIENLYATHTIRAEARLEMAGLDIFPTGQEDRQLFPGEDLIFSWSLTPDSPGTYRGVVWLKLRYLPKAGGDEIEKVLYNQPLEIQGLNLLGLGGRTARILGLVGTGITSLFGLDDIFTWVRRMRSGKTRNA